MFFIYPGRAAIVRDREMTFLSLIQSVGIGDRNLTFIVDPYGDNYARGLNDQIPDLAALLDWHRARLRECPHVTEWHTLGNSSGGYGAMLFGHLLGARTVWATSPRTARLETADAAKARLREHLSAWNGTTEYFIYYSPSNGRDRAFAEYFAQSPGVALCPYEVPPLGSVEGFEASTMDAELWQHWGVMRTMRASGDLRRLMPAFLPAGKRGPAASG
jgi:hypothetical protein